MGTRADFYIKEDKEWEWLGSVGWDGYEWHEDKNNPLILSKTKELFKNAVKFIELHRDDFTLPEQGWPWPWNDSTLTDYSYVFENGKVDVYIFGELVIGYDDELEEDITTETKSEFPDMSEIQNVTLGKRSGVIIIG